MLICIKPEKKYINLSAFVVRITVPVVLFLFPSQANVACSSLAGLNRQIIVSKGLEKPRGIAVHPSEK